MDNSELPWWPLNSMTWGEPNPDNWGKLPPLRLFIPLHSPQWNFPKQNVLTWGVDAEGHPTLLHLSQSADWTAPAVSSPPCCVYHRVLTRQRQLCYLPWTLEWASPPSNPHQHPKWVPPPTTSITGWQVRNTVPFVAAPARIMDPLRNSTDTDIGMHGNKYRPPSLTALHELSIMNLTRIQQLLPPVCVQKIPSLPLSHLLRHRLCYTMCLTNAPGSICRESAILSELQGQCNGSLIDNGLLILYFIQQSCNAFCYSYKYNVIL